MTASAAGQQHRGEPVGELTDSGADRRDLARNIRCRRRYSETEAAQQGRTAALEADTGLGLQDEIAGCVLIEPLHIELDRRIGCRGYCTALGEDGALRQPLTQLLDQNPAQHRAERLAPPVVGHDVEPVALGRANYLRALQIAR